MPSPGTASSGDADLDGVRCTGVLPYRSADGETYRGPRPFRTLDKRLPLRVLSADDWAHWQRRGYVVVRSAVARHEADATFRALCDYQGYDPADRATWTPPGLAQASALQREMARYGLVEAYHHPRLWNHRQARRIYDAFVDLWDHPELWVTLDRANLNPPNIGARTFDRPFLHWDIDSRLDPPPMRLQGILALHDTTPEAGGFQCVPGLFEHFATWSRTRPDDDPADPDAREYPDLGAIPYPVERPALRAGDLLVWNAQLLHGIAPNASRDRLRAVQYLSMMPALEDHAMLRASRVASWRERSVPAWDPSFVGHPTIPEASRYGPARLTPLGERLLGLSTWTAPFDASED